MIQQSTILLVLAIASSVYAQTELCRCTAKFEHFYDNRRTLLRDDRSLSFRNYVYDYSDYYIDDDGYYIVEGVRVLRDDDPACDDEYDDRSDSVLGKIFGYRVLNDNDEENAFK